METKGTSHSFLLPPEERKEESHFELELVSSSAMNNGGYTFKLTLPEEIKSRINFVRFSFQETEKIAYVEQKQQQILILEPLITLTNIIEIPIIGITTEKLPERNEFIASCVAVNENERFVDIYFITTCIDEGIIYFKVKQPRINKKEQTTTGISRNSKRFITKTLLERKVKEAEAEGGHRKRKRDEDPIVDDSVGNNDETKKRNKTVGHNLLNRLWKLFFGMRLYLNTVENGIECPDKNKRKIGETPWKELKWRENKIGFYDDGIFLIEPSWYSRCYIYKKSDMSLIPDSTTTSSHLGGENLHLNEKSVQKGSKGKLSHDLDDDRALTENDCYEIFTKEELQKDLYLFCERTSLIFFYDNLKKLGDVAFICKRPELIANALCKLFNFTFTKGYYLTIFDDVIRNQLNLEKIDPHSMTCSNVMRRTKTGYNFPCVVEGDFLGIAVNIQLVWEYHNENNLLHCAETETYFVNTFNDKRRSYKHRICYPPLLRDYSPTLEPKLTQGLNEESNRKITVNVYVKFGDYIIRNNPLVYFTYEL